MDERVLAAGRHPSPKGVHKIPLTVSNDGKGTILLRDQPWHVLVAGQPSGRASLEGRRRYNRTVELGLMHVELLEKLCTRQILLFDDRNGTEIFAPGRKGKNGFVTDAVSSELE